ARNSSASARDSSSRSVSASISGVAGTSASAFPRHSASAWVSSSTARDGSPSARACLPTATRRGNWAASTSPRLTTTPLPGALAIPDEPAQMVHIYAQQIARLGRRPARPDLLRENIGGYRLAGVDQQGCQQGPPLGCGDRRPVRPGPGLNRAQNPEQDLPGWLNHGLIVAQTCAATLLFSHDA